ncbi:MAG: SipW-dependent-type signal peptide-containing protein [Peptostreptococcaceae bacterium]|nr:SipW-dependent-type signal peptide-containing protein [Peptostreptococcaceae bacterium]
MKRTGRRSLISGILALSLVLAGTGYAYWTDTLNVTTKATTGDFGVTFVDLGLYAQYGNEVLKGGWSIVDGIGDSGFVDDHFFMRGATDYNAIAKPGSIDAYKERAKGYNNIEFDAELKDAKPIPKQVGPYTAANAKGSDKIELTIQRMYPGYAQAFRSDILNVGDIAAKLANMKFDVKALDGKEIGKADEMLGLAVLINKEQYAPSHLEENVFKLASFLNDPSKCFKVGGVDFVRLSALKDKDFKDALQNNLVLCAPATDQRMDIFLAVAMDPDAKGVYTTGTVENFVGPAEKDLDSQNKGIQVSIDLLWDQFNVGKDAANPNILKLQNVGE